MDRQSRNIMLAAMDPMCYPQVWDDLRDPDETFAHDLKGYIEFCLKGGTPEMRINPMDAGMIY